MKKIIFGMCYLNRAAISEAFGTGKRIVYVTCNPWQEKDGDQYLKDAFWKVSSAMELEMALQRGDHIFLQCLGDVLLIQPLEQKKYLMDLVKKLDEETVLVVDESSQVFENMDMPKAMGELKDLEADVIVTSRDWKLRRLKGWQHVDVLLRDPRQEMKSWKGEKA